MSDNRFILMHKDIPVCEVKINKNGFITTQMFEYSLIPVGTRSHGGDIQNFSTLLTMWNHHRCIPAVRPYYKDLKEKYGIEDDSQWVEHSFMCSINDTYWFKPSGSNIAWKDVNFHDNNCSSDLGKFLFYGDEKSISNLNSVDLTTNGGYPKYWEKRNGTYYLLKTSDTGKIADHEAFAAAMLKKLNIPHVPYTIEYDGALQKNVSVCPNFIEPNEDFIPMANMIMDYAASDSNPYEFLCNSNLQTYADEMFAFDFILANIDRHTENYGFLLNADTQQFTRMAPHFDQGTLYLLTNPKFLHTSMGNMPFELMLKNIRSVPQWVFDENAFNYEKELLAQISYFDEEDLDKAIMLVDQRKEILRNHANNLNRSRNIL